MNSEAEGLLAAASKGLCPLYLLFPGPGETSSQGEKQGSGSGGGYWYPVNKEYPYAAGVQREICTSLW